MLVQLRAELGIGNSSCGGEGSGELHASGSEGLGGHGGFGAGHALRRSAGVRWGMHVSVVLVTIAALLFFERGDSPALSRKIVSSIIFPVSLFWQHPFHRPILSVGCAVPATAAASVKKPTPLHACLCSMIACTYGRVRVTGYVVIASIACKSRSWWGRPADTAHACAADLVRVGVVLLAARAGGVRERPQLRVLVPAGLPVPPVDAPWLDGGVLLRRLSRGFAERSTDYAGWWPRHCRGRFVDNSQLALRHWVYLHHCCSWAKQCPGLCSSRVPGWRGNSRLCISAAGAVGS